MQHRIIGHLLDLRIEGDTITKHYLADNALRAIAASCPNLLVFTYMLSSYYYDASMDSLSGGALKTMIEGCRRLEVLRLLEVLSIKRADVASILELLDGANEGDFALPQPRPAPRCRRGGSADQDLVAEPR